MAARGRHGGDEFLVAAAVVVPHGPYSYSLLSLSVEGGFRRCLKTIAKGKTTRKAKYGFKTTCKGKTTTIGKRQ